MTRYLENVNVYREYAVAAATSRSNNITNNKQTIINLTNDKKVGWQERRRAHRWHFQQVLFNIIDEKTYS